MHMTGETGGDAELHRGQSFGHEHALSPPKRRRPNLTKHLSRLPLLVIGNLKVRVGVINFAIAILGGHCSDTMRDTLGCPWGGLLCQQTSFPEACLGMMPSSQTVNLSAAGMRSADGRTAAHRDRSLYSVPRHRVSRPDWDGCPHGDRHVHIETSAHLLISKWTRTERRRFVLYQSN